MLRADRRRNVRRIADELEDLRGEAQDEKLDMLAYLIGIAQLEAVDILTKTRREGATPIDVSTKQIAALVKRSAAGN